MTKHQYLDELEAQLYFLGAAEREDALREFGSHIDDTVAARQDLSEEEVVGRLPPPASVSARYHAEAGETPEAEDAGTRSGSRGGRRGFSLGDLGSMFRFARREERELCGQADGVERLEIRAASCDLSLRCGEGFTWRATGRWDDGKAPEGVQEGSRYLLRCEGEVDELELTLPPAMVEVIVVSASGDLSAVLPSGTCLSARLASGDLSCTADGGAVAVSSASGDIEIGGSPAGVEVSSSSGDVCVHGAGGDVRVATQSGDISLSLASADSDAEASSMSGDVQVNRAPGATPEILAESVSGEVDAPGIRRSRGRGATGGAVHADGGPGRIHARSVSGDVAVR